MLQGVGGTQVHIKNLSSRQVQRFQGDAAALVWASVMQLRLISFAASNGDGAIPKQNDSKAHTRTNL